MIIAGAALFIVANGLSICIGWRVQSPRMMQLGKPPKLAVLRIASAELTNMSSP
jgi:hypothetical protein